MAEEDAHFAAQMRAGALEAGLEERHALARIEERLFGRQIKPITFSRYVLLEPCGRGSSGMVYRAYDPQLDRKVAIKLLLARKSSGAHEAALLREARAMARVSHVNVIAVYDVGSYDEDDLGLDRNADVETMLADLEVPSRGVFVVMELIEGMDLREWLNAERRDWREIVRAFIAAGRGLAAAHEAGLVHRDFKPTNVRVAVDGRICVLDFGLARALADDDVARPRVIGTPMYMSPEQHRGELADERSDQYSFGVALYEALVAASPFTGTMLEISARKHAGDWLRIPDQQRAVPACSRKSRSDFWECVSAHRRKALKKVPPVLWTIVRRCVEPDPAARFASLSELLDALESSLGARRRRWLALAALPVAALLAGAFAVARASAVQPTVDLCSGADARVARVWNDSVRARIEARLRGSGAPYAEATWAEVRRELDNYTVAWAQQHREACEATRLRGEQSEQTLDLRMACLDRRLHEVEVVTRTLATADAAVVENAVMAANALGWLGACADLDALRSRVRLPRAAEHREQIERGYARLSEAMIFDAAGRYDDALAIAREVAAQARLLDYGPLLGAADLRRAAAHEARGEFAAAEQALLDALAAAEAARDEEVAADAWLRMVWVVGVEQVRSREGEAWLRLAEAAVARLGDDPLREATLIHNRAGLHLRQGRREEALEGYLRALDNQIELLGSNDPVVARTMNHIANTLIMLQRGGEAWSYALRSLELRIDTLGADHPLVAASYNNMAEIRRHQNDPTGALAVVEQALAIEAIEGTRTELVSRSLARDAHRMLGQLEQARMHIERLLELPEELYPPYMTREGLAAELRQMESGDRPDSTR